MINITKSELLEYHKMMQSKDNNLKNFINLYGNLAFVDSELVQEVRTSQDISNLELDVHTLEQKMCIRDRRSTIAVVGIVTRVCIRHGGVSTVD